jgi:hypothetical protein
MTPPEITGDLRDRIVAGLLRLDAARQSRRAERPRLAESLEGAFDIYARELARAGWPLTTALLNESIPFWVFMCARDRRWLLETQPLRGVRGNLLQGWMRMDRPVRRIPEAELQASVRKQLTGRITYWEAEALLPESSPDAERPVDLLARVRTRYNTKAIVHEAGVGRSTFYQWSRRPHSVRAGSAEAIVSALRRLARTLSK